jgi:aromatic-L-amino-acid/L-tryptophan decarboxylase
MSAGSAWDWAEDELERVGARVARLIATYLSELPERPVWQPVPESVAAAFLGEPAPAAGASAEAILDEFETLVAPFPFGQGHPRFFGWVNSPPDPLGVFGAALAAAMNPSCAGGDHAALHVERQVIAWLNELLGLPGDGAGLLVSGGSAATLTALAAARHAKAGWDVREEGLQSGPAPLVVYAGEEGHSAIRRAVELLGIGRRNLRLIPADRDYRLDVAALERAVEEDLAGGLRPIAVAASAGTVNTGAIDPLGPIAELCRAHGLWLHVDGAYGAPAVLTERYRAELEPLALADSVAVDPHKWLYVPIDAGAVLVRDVKALPAAFSVVPAYIREEGGEPWLSELGLEQTRPFRALRVWMALKRYGLAGYARLIDHDLELADRLSERVNASERLELVARGLSIVCFRYVPPGLDGSELDRLNRLLLSEVQHSGEAFCSGTVLSGAGFVLRACIVNPRASEADVERLAEIVVEIGDRLSGTTPGAMSSPA